MSYRALPSAYLWPFLSTDLVMLRSADGALEQLDIEDDDPALLDGPTS